MTVQKQLEDIESAYDIVFSENLSSGKKIHIGSKCNHVCRFCGQSEPKVTFRSTAHAIPESLGNRRVTLLNECDECNEYFSRTIENCFDKYTKPYRLFFGIKGKKKIPSYKTDDKSARIDVSNYLKQLKVSGDEAKIVSDATDNSIKLKVNRESYIPMNIYKALLKMALSVIDAGYLPKLEEHLKWVRVPNYAHHFSFPLPLVERFSYGPSFNGGSYAILFIRRHGISESNPFMMFFLCVGNVYFQIPIPESNETISSLPLFPIPDACANNKFGYEQSSFDLSSSQRVSSSELIFSLCQSKT